jgi:hypothetical protein
MNHSNPTPFIPNFAKRQIFVCPQIRQYSGLTPFFHDPFFHFSVFFRAEVPLHYLLNFSSDAFTIAIELGINAGREWCQSEGIAFSNTGSTS